MCGIAGVYHYRTLPHNPAELAGRVSAMLDAQVHRGPDDAGQVTRGHVSLGMRRLAIIDRAGGQQPIANEAGDTWVVFNGEIYNYRDLQNTLRGRHTLRSSGDTEVLVHLYEDRRERMVDDLNGIFALAIWDERADRLFIARDQLGVKPLYYAEHGGAFYFASEIPALLAGIGETPPVDMAVLDLYLALGYIPSPYTIYKGIKSLPAGHRLVIDSSGVALDSYWQLRYETERTRDEAHYVHEIQARLRQAVRSQLMSEVPLGAFLSGGLDSTALVAIMSEELAGPVKTFSLGFEEESFNELSDARKVAEHYQTEHEERVVKPVHVAGALERMILSMGQPIGAWSAVLNDMVAELASRKVTVALAGHGGDEIFGGYPTLTAHKLMERFGSMPRVVRRMTEGIVGLLPVTDGNLPFDERARLFMRGAGLSFDQAFLAWKRIFAPNERRMLLAQTGTADVTTDLASELYARYANEIGDSDKVNRLLHIDTKVFLEGSCLAVGDRSSMAHSLEVRVPFLDRTIVEYAATVPASLKHRGATTKYILRRALARWLPPEILARKKTGFVLPESRWLRTNLREFMMDELRALEAWPLLGERGGAFIRGMVDAHTAGRANHGRALTTLISLAVWLRQSRRAGLQSARCGTGTAGFQPAAGRTGRAGFQPAP